MKYLRKFPTVYIRGLLQDLKMSEKYKKYGEKLKKKSRMI